MGRVQSFWRILPEREEKGEFRIRRVRFWTKFIFKLDLLTFGNIGVFIRKKAAWAGGSFGEKTF